MEIPLVVDRILAFAVHKVYSLEKGLAFLSALPNTDTPWTQRHFIRRLVPMDSLGALGRLDLLQSLDCPVSDRTIELIALGAAGAGHVHLLHWTRDSRPTHAHFQPISDRSFSNWPLQHAFVAALRNGHTEILDWCVAVTGTSFRSELYLPFCEATYWGQVRSLAWLKAYATRHGLTCPPFYQVLSSPKIAPIQPAERVVATLDWWVAEHATQPPQGPFMICAANMEAGEFPLRLMCNTDNGLLMIDWWRAYCAGTGQPSALPILATALPLWLMCASNNLAQFQVWWEDTALQVGRDQAAALLTQSLDDLCEHGNIHFLDWFWDLACNSATTKVMFSRAWRPMRPFGHLNVIRWWEAKVASGEVDADVLDIISGSFNGSKLDTLMEKPIATSVDVDAVEWWWARRGQYDLEPSLSPLTFSNLLRYRDFDLLQWYIEQCTADSPLPSVTLCDLASIVAQDRLGMMELPDRPSFPIVTAGGRSVARFQEEGSLPVLTVFDGVWSQVTARDAFNISVGKVLSALNDGCLDVARWYYAMHRVHGTVFPSALELKSVKCAPASAVGLWLGYLLPIHQKIHK
ncbi:hypothetical protein BC828DRAFT_91969 [Blastocladiella britannica]|nr:hypothetical protein BC828DRAFT_91969 [Blastocladiella britannica]